MPTVLKYDILKLTDKDGRPIEKFDFIDPENPKLLINPSLGKTYVCTIYVLNSSEWRVLHIRLSTSYEDVRIEPSYVASLRSQKSVKIRLIWRPFTEKGISEKVKDGKVSINFSPSSVVEVISEVTE